MQIKETHFVGKIAQKAIIVHEGNVLLLRNAQDPVEAPWELPGGRLNQDEDPIAGLKRELMEELGLAVEVGPVVHIERFVLKRTGELHVLIVYEATLQDVAASIEQVSDEVLEYRFVPLSEIDTVPLYDEYKRALTKCAVTRGV